MQICEQGFLEPLKCFLEGSAPPKRLITTDLEDFIDSICKLNWNWFLNWSICNCYEHRLAREVHGFQLLCSALLSTKLLSYLRQSSLLYWVYEALHFLFILINVWKIYSNKNDVIRSMELHSNHVALQLRREGTLQLIYSLVLPDLKADY